MLKKRIMLSIGAFVIVLLLLICINYIPTPNLSFGVKYEKNDICQVFQGGAIPNFTNEYSDTHTVNSDGSTQIALSWDKKMVQARIDFGDQAQMVRLTDVRLEKWNIQFGINEEDILFINEAALISENKNNFQFETRSGDPYIVLSTLNAQTEYAKGMQTNMRFLYLLCALLAAIVTFFQYEHCKILIFWTLDILRNTVLIIELATSDFKTKYASSYLGITWAFVQPVVTILIYVIVFGYGFKSTPVENFPFVLWLSAGIIPWLFFSEALTSSTMSLKEYSFLVKKVVFEVKILPLVKIMAAFYIHLVFIIIVFALYLANGYLPTIYYLQLLYYAFCTLALSLGISYVTSALNVFVPDLIQIINIGLQFGMWMTPIMWSPNLFGPKIEKILQINPMFYIVQGYRDSFYNKIPFWEKPGLTTYFWCCTLVLLVVGMYTFRKLEKHFADVL